MGKQISVLLTIFCLFLIGCNKKDEETIPKLVEVATNQPFECSVGTTYTEKEDEEGTALECFCLDENNQKTGLFYVYYLDTKTLWVLGEYKNDKTVGKWALWDKEKNLRMLGYYNDNSQPDGLGVFYLEDGDYKVIYVDNGEPPNEILVFESNGNLKEIILRDAGVIIPRIQIEELALEIEKKVKEDLAKALKDLPTP